MNINEIQKEIHKNAIAKGWHEEKCLVFFGGRFAYHADYCEALKEDLARQLLVGVSKKGKYISK